MRASRQRTLAVLIVIVLVAAVLGVRLYQVTETIPPQPPTVAQVERQMRREMRRGWIRVLLADRVLEVRVNGEAVLGYTGKAPRLEDVDTLVVRGIALKALNLYAPPRFGPAPGIDSVRIRLRHAYMLGPFNYRTSGRDFSFPASTLRR
ncbi:MAG TPA: hypothetical protein VFO55_12725 [Gemmatimonadaceae bacterium]|nr:hypothetical protein [Gemmatimonadaceae bacterium]